MGKKLKITLIIIDAIVTLGVIWGILNWDHIKNFPKILPSFHSKEYCSCYFVVKQSKEYCEDYARQWIPISGYSIDEATKTITTRGMGQVVSSKYESEKFGCRLQ